MKVKIIEGSFTIASKAENPTMPDWLTPIIMQLVPNIVMPMAAENKQISQGIQQQEQQEQMAQQEQMMQQQEGEPQMQMQ